MQPKPQQGADIHIREASLADVPGIVHVFMGDETSPKGDIWNEETRPVYEAAFARIASDRSQRLLVVEAGGAVIGTAQITLIPGLSRAASCARNLRACMCARNGAARASESSLCTTPSHLQRRKARG